MITTRYPGCRVFVVEDEASLRADLCFLLQHRGYQVTACASAAEFYRQFAVQSGNVVILDIGLEGEDGLSICQHLRAHDPLLGIIFLTARSLRDDRVHGLMTGADAYMVKPVELDELSLTIDRLEDRRRLAQSASLTAVPSSLNRPDPALKSVESPALTASGVDATTCAGGPGWWTFGLASGTLTAPNGLARRLTGNERTVIYCLVQRSGQPATVEDLARQLLIPNPAEAKHRVEVIVSRLRRSVEGATGQSLPLFLMRGVGYCLRDMQVVDA